ncbi:MAG: PepSY-associated TM helix domain-containing protein [Gammaproteobacteria bacterium]|nr:PepSY-associated TM helix domain-containing protein [Gammaproteobacteria bacterium]
MHRVVLRFLFSLHRRVGVSLLIFIILLSVSGIMLNHTESFHLDERYVQQGWILKLYGIQTADPDTVYTVDEHYLFALDGDLYLDSEAIASGFGKLIGAMRIAETLFVVSDNKILLLSDNGDVLEQIDGLLLGVFGTIDGLGKSGNKLILSIEGRAQKLDIESLRLTHIEDSSRVTWARATALNDTMRDELPEQVPRHALSWERVILDLHSGRIVGGWGVWFMDLVAILLITLSLAGAILWYQRISRSKAR